MREADKGMMHQIRNRRSEGFVEKVIKKICNEAGVKEELKGGGQRRKVSEGRAKIVRYLSKDMKISMAEIARNLGVGASAIAKAIRKGEQGD